MIAVPTSIIIGMLGLVLIAIGIVTLVLANMSAATNTNQSDSRESQHNGNLSSVIESLNADNIQSYPTATLTEILSSPAGIDYALRRKIEKELNLREQ